MMHLAVAINDKDRELMPIFVSIFTLSKSYHTELVFSNGEAVICGPSGIYFGTRTYDKYHWVLVPIPWITEDEEEEVRVWCQKVVDEHPKYDWLGAICGGISAFIENPKKWFCSELCCAALQPYTEPLSKDATNIFLRKWWTPELLWRTVSEYLADNFPDYSNGWKIEYGNLASGGIKKKFSD